MSETNNTDIEEMSFEQAYAELEDTVKKLEAGSLSLAESLSLYQRGMALSKYCALQLDQAELTIQTVTPSGQLVDFEED